MQSARHYLVLMFYRAYAEFRAEGSRAYIGFLWWVVEPLLYLGVFYLILDTGLRRGGTSVMPFLLCGLVPWKWFASTVSSSCTSLKRNAAIISQVYLPKVVLPGITVIFSTFKFLIVLLILLFFLLVLFHRPVTTAWLALPLVILVQLCLLGGIALIVAGIVPAAPDLKLVIDNLLTMLFFVSGVFFDISRTKGTIHTILTINPVAVLLECYRTVLLKGHWPPFESLGWILGLSFVLLMAGTALMMKFDRVYPKLVM